MDNRPPRKILKSPVAKRRSRLVPKDQKVTLEKVLGLTSTNNAALACDPNTGNIAYLAGCVVIIYNPKKNKQSHIFNFSKKTLTAVAFSGDGKHLVTGESGHQPAVRIWDVTEKVQVAEFHGHKFGISCVAFSPNLKYIVSIGTQHDMQVNVWNWKSGSKVASNKISSKVTAVSFSADGSYFVTAGMRHVKFWYLDSSKSKINETVPLSGRNGILGDYKNNFFCDVARGTGNQDNRTYCITQSGILCQFNEKRQMDKWVDLRTTCATCIAAADDLIFVGCANGIVRVFDSGSLQFVVTLPRPHYLGVDIAAAISASHIHTVKDGDIKYPDTVALAFDEGHRKVTCIYNDHSIYIWDVHDLKKIGKSWSFLFHSSCVYGVEVYPVVDPSQASILPNHSFITCSSDDTIRIWNLDPHMAQTDTYKSNIYSHDLLKIMYMDPSLASLCDVDYNPSGAADKTDTNYDDKNGIRSIRVSPDGQHLASGDRQGNVRIHELKHLTEVRQIEAHESEVLCLEYSQWRHGPKVLASSSRDRLVHVYDTEQHYGLLQTLSDHSSSISAVKFTETDGHLKMLTCGADKSILFRNLQQEPDFQFVLGDHLVEKMTLYDMDVEPSQKFAAIACQDRNVRIYNVKTGKKKKEYKGSLGDDGILLKMKLDPSGSYAATSCSDKNLCILDFYTGELLATMYGHSEIATDVRFMNDLKHVISTSGDGCIFIWRLPKEMTSHMQNRLQEMGKAPYLVANGSIRKDSQAKHLDELDSVPVSLGREYFSPQKVLNDIYPDNQMSSNCIVPDRNSPDYRFSISQLPSWAQKRMNNGSDTQVKEPGTNQTARGRWAERAEGQPLTLKQQDGKLVEFDFATDRRRFTPESESLSSQLADVRRETMVLNRPSTAPTDMPIIHNDTMIEDDEDEDFLPVSSTTFVKQDSDKPSVSWEDLYNFDADDVEQPENTEIIYYPPSESDGSDTLASSYQVFDAGHTLDRSKLVRQSFSMNSNPDADSETTDPVSLEDTEEEEDSNPSAPSTPMEDFNPKTQHREKFLKDAFENLSFTPSLPTDKFVKGLDTLEEEMASNSPTSSITSRQSLSARFMSRSNAQRGTFGIQRQDNWFDSVQRRKDDMARNLDESRKMLMAMGWKQDSPETDKEDGFASSPPSLSKSKALSPSPDKLVNREGEDTPTHFTFDPNHTLVESSEPPAISTSNCSEIDKDKTPTSGKSALLSTTRPRTLQLGKADNKAAGSTTSSSTTTTKTTPTASSSSRTGLYTRKTTTTSNHPVYQKSDKRGKNSRMSAPNLSKVATTEPQLDIRRSSLGSNLNKSKSSSMHSLTFVTEDLQKEPTKPRACWSKTNLSSYGSVPNLLSLDEEENTLFSKSPVEKTKVSKDDVSRKKESPSVRSTSKQSLHVNKSGKSTSSKVEPSTQVNTSKTSGRSPGSALNRSSSVEDRGRNRTTNVAPGKKVNDKVSDRDLMPPPLMPVLAKQKQETRFMRRAHQQARRKTTSDLTLEQATDILKGNSGILKKNQKEKRSSSSSPSGDRNKVVNSEKENFQPISDSNFLTVASEIEQTAAELRRQNISGFQGEAMPNDLPERDIPPVHDIPDLDGPIILSGNLVNKNAVNKTDKNQNEVVKPNIAVSSVLNKETADEGDAPSPSVKERIARLNKHVNDTQRQASPHLDRGRSQSPAPVSPRVTTSVKVNFSTNNTSQVPTTAVTTSMSSSIDSAISCSNSDSVMSPSPRGSRGSIQPIPFDPHGEINNLSNTSKAPNPPVSSVMTTSGQRPGSPAVLASNLDSEGLSHHLSPSSYHCNTSPQSIADTGVGSDTDFDLSVSQCSTSTFKGDHKGDEDPVTVLQETMDQINKLTEKAMKAYQQIQGKNDERSVEAKKRFQDQFPAMTGSVADSPRLTGSYGNQSMIHIPRDKYDSLTDLLLKVNSVAADIRHCANQ